MKRALTCAAVVAASAALLATTPANGAPPQARTFKNCTEMHKSYPHGVGLHGARDHTSGTPVTNFYRNNHLYNANTKSDRGHDHIACEAR